MNIHIHSAACISPGSSREDLHEPDYAKVLDPRMLRRMSRVIKMGAAAAMDTMSRSEKKMPDAIIVGTAYGCLQDTETFLSKMVEQQEQLLTPTAFIQSTHNTVGAQVALMLGCHGYNNTFVHRGHSFESALVDASLLLDEGYGMILAGGVDEATDTSRHLLHRFRVPAGEGSAFFTLSNGSEPGSMARLTGLRLLRDAGPDEVAAAAGELVRSSDNVSTPVDLILQGGQKGHPSGMADELLGERYAGAQRIAYKTISGDHPTVSGFALWMAADLLQKGSLDGRPVNKILVHNSWLERYTSLFLVEHA